MFLKLDELEQDYVIRLKFNRNLLYHNKWTPATELCNRRKGRFKTNVFYKGKDHDAYLSHVKVQLTAINALNFYITLCMAFLALISMESETSALKASIIQNATPIKKKIHFCYYRLAKVISGILSYAKEGVRLWFRRGLLKCLYSQDCYSIPFKK